MNVDIDNLFHNQFHKYYRLHLTDSIFSFLYYLLLIKKLVYITYNAAILSFIFHPNIYMVQYLQSFKLPHVLHGAKYLLLYI
jgi:hypothetical protein